MTAASCDINSRRGLSSAIYIGVVGPAVFIVQPGFVQGLVEQLGFSEQQAGYVASVEMWGLAATTLLMSFIAARVNWRLMLLASALTIAVANLLSMAAPTPGVFTVVRGVAGIGSGTLVSLAFTIIGLSRNPDRNFGFLIMWVLVYGAAGFFVMPTAYQLVGMDGVLLFFALFGLSIVPLLGNLPAHGEEHFQVDADAVDLGFGYKALAVAAMFSYFVAQGVVWAYYFLIGTGAGVAEQDVANALTLSQFLGIAGALLAAVTGKRFGRLLPITLGIGGSVLSLLLLIGQFNALTYAISVCLFNFVWNMTHPFLLAAMASFDRSGRLVVHAVSAQMIGIAVGPALAASIINPGQYASIIWLGVGLFVVSQLLVMPPIIGRQRQEFLALQTDQPV